MDDYALVRYGVSRRDVDRSTYFEEVRWNTDKVVEKKTRTVRRAI